MYTFSIDKILSCKKKKCQSEFLFGICFHMWNLPVFFVDLKVVGPLTDGGVEWKRLIQVTCFWGTKAAKQDWREKYLLLFGEWLVFVIHKCIKNPEKKTL